MSTSSTGRRWRSAAVAAPAAAALAALSLGACSSSPSYQGTCVDKRTQVRVDDRQCDHGGHGGAYGWYFWNTSGARRSSVAPIGGKVSGGTFSAPKGASISRGGFGAKGGSVGG